ncbi:MAG: hypothetical protein HY898_33725 [Deltaproteobacteria bacterium]|nr:hypothetical protein [Deltaproteobacteria bacterium]
MTRISVIVPTALVLLLAAPAMAQTPVLGGHVGATTGMEAGDPGSGQTTFRRARTRVMVGVDGRVDEDLKNGLGLVVFAEIEPHATLGGELRYMRWFSPNVIGFVGATGVFAPRTLLGADFGLQFHLPMAAGVTVFFEPSFAALPLGTDLPSDRVLVWGLLSGGIHAKF